MKSFKAMLEEAKTRDTYWIDRAVLAYLGQLEEFMRDSELNRSDLAKRLGTSKAYLSKIFSGNSNFTVATMVRLARAVGAKVEIRLTPNVEASQSKEVAPKAEAESHFSGFPWVQEQPALGTAWNFVAYPDRPVTLPSSTSISSWETYVHDHLHGKCWGRSDQGVITLIHTEEEETAPSVH
jgi:transcriptional regulator with XRE-family HTH domain